MLKQEFEERVGYKVTDEEYKTIEEVYYNSDLDKDEFCADWEKHKDSKIILNMHEKLTTYVNGCKAYQKQEKDTAQLLIAIYYERDDQRARQMALNLLGTRGYIKEVLSMDVTMSAKDKQILISLL